MGKMLRIAVNIFGFWYGSDGFWFQVLFPEDKKENESIEAKQYQFIFIIRPILVTFIFWMFYLFFTNFPGAVMNVLGMESWIGYKFGMLQQRIDDIGLILNGIDKVVGDTFGPLAILLPYNFSEKASAIIFYILLYNFSKKRLGQYLVSKSEQVLKEFPKLRDVLAEIYIETPGVGKLKLSVPWENVKKNLSTIIFVNFFAFRFLDSMTHFASKHFWKSTPQDLIPFTGFFCFMELYHYLSFANVNRNRRKPDATLDLVKLRADYQHYANIHGIGMDDTYKRNHEFLNEIENFDNNNQNSSDWDLEFLYQYLAERGQLEHTGIAVKLLKGKNVFYASPFYKDIDACIFFRMFHTLMQQGKGLLLTPGNENIKELVEWMRKGLESISGLKELWHVEELNEPIGDVDVGVMSFQNIELRQSIDRLKKFFGEVSFVVILRASDMLIGGQEMILALAENIHRYSKQCIWLLCDWNAESMLDIFSHLLSADFSYVSATPVGAKETVISYWDVETEPNYIWDPAKRFLGMEVGIAEVAGRNQVPCMVWYGEEWMPVIDMSWIIGQYYKLYSKKVLQPSIQSKMNVQIQCKTSAISSKIEKESFLVVEDSYCNLYEVGRQYTTRAKDKLYVHILSPNYLLRNFMKSQAETMYYDPKYIAQFTPEYVNSKRNVYLHLIRRLLEGEVSEKVIAELLCACEEEENFDKIISNSSYGMKQGIKRFVEILFNITLNKDTEIKATSCQIFSEQDRGEIYEWSFQIISSDVKTMFYKYFQQACYMDETGKKYNIQRLMLAGHLHLKYLPGQYITLEGKYYQVERLLELPEETLLVVKRASEQVVERCYYRQLRVYNFLMRNTTAKCIYQEAGIRLTRLTTDFQAKTEGYITIRKRWNDFEGALENKFQGNSPQQLFFREYKGKQVLRIELPLDKNAREQLFNLGAVIHEMFYTLYPQYCHLLSVAVQWQGEEEQKRRYRGILSEVKYDDIQTVMNAEEQNMIGKDIKGCFYIFEDSCEDMGILRSIERHFRRILQIAAEYIQWERDKEPYFPG